MSLTTLNMADLIGASVAFVLTLLILSYLVGDNPLFRIALHLFVGVASGLAVVIAFYNVLWPQLIEPLVFGVESNRFLLLIPLLLSLLLFMKVSPGLTNWGRLAVVFLVGVGAATAIGGAVTGTLFPQVLASINLFGVTSTPGSGGDILLQLGEGALIVFGTLTTLAYFQFGVRAKSSQNSQRTMLMEIIAWVGQVFIAITFGAIFAGVFLGSLGALVERLGFLVDFILALPFLG